MKTGGNFLRLGRVGKQVASDLLDRELVERHVLIQSFDNPVTVGPDVSQVVALKTVRVGIAGNVQPRASPPFAELRSLQEFINELLETFVRRIASEGVVFFRSWRQADQVEKDSAYEFLRSGLW